MSGLNLEELQEALGDGQKLNIIKLEELKDIFFKRVSEAISCWKWDHDNGDNTFPHYQKMMNQLEEAEAIWELLTKKLKE